MVDEFILIKIKGEIEIVQIEKEQFLDKCYELIKCECIEYCVLNIKDGNTPIRFILDKSGKLNDQEFNPLASAIYNRPDVLFGNVLVGQLGCYRSGETTIVGFEYWELDELLEHFNAQAELLKCAGLI